MIESATSDRSRAADYAGWIERAGNWLPHPFWLFVILTLILAGISAFGSAAEWSLAHPGTGKTEAVRNLFSRDGVSWLLANWLENIAHFRPLTLVLTMLVGIGLAERSGLFEAAIRRAVVALPRQGVPAAVIFLSILGNIASDVSYLILPPIGAAVFAAVGRPPIAGFCAALAGTGAGYTANLFIAGTDVLSAGISTQAAQLVKRDEVVSPLSNWYFMSSSVFVLTALGAVLTTRWLEPRVARFQAGATDLAVPVAEHSRPLRMALWAAIAYAGLLAALTLPAGGWLHAAPGESFDRSPFMRGIVPLLSLGFAVVAIAYGTAAGTIRRPADVPRLIGEAAREMVPFFVVAVVIAQFLAAFQWTNLGLYVAVEGAELARAANFDGLPFLFALSLLTAVLSLFVASSSVLWSMLAPVFVPVGMLLGYHPAVPQLAFRIAESSTNIITPVTPYLVVLLPHLQRLRPNAGLGTLIAMMFPYTVAFFTAWLLLLAAWHALGWPIGPGVPIHPTRPAN